MEFLLNIITCAFAKVSLINVSIKPGRQNYEYDYDALIMWHDADVTDSLHTGKA